MLTASLFHFFLSSYVCRRSGRLPRVLVLAPTRELAKQVEKEIKESAPNLSTVCVYGGVSYITQQNALSRGVDVVVGTPGRIIDLINGNSLKLGEVEYLVLDEADQMLAVGFEEDVEVILEKLPSKRQSMLFSATMPAWVKKLARKYLDNPLTIDLVIHCFLFFFLTSIFHDAAGMFVLWVYIDHFLYFCIICRWSSSKLFVGTCMNGY